MKIRHLLLLFFCILLVSCNSEANKLSNTCDIVSQEIDNATDLESLMKVNIQDLRHAALKDSIYMDVNIEKVQPKVFTTLHKWAIKMNTCMEDFNKKTTSPAFHFSTSLPTCLNMILPVCTTEEEVKEVKQLNDNAKGIVLNFANGIFAGYNPQVATMCADNIMQVDRNVDLRLNEISRGNLYNSALLNIYENK